MRFRISYDHDHLFVYDVPPSLKLEKCCRILASMVCGPWNLL
jgi:hypothetical protein